MLNNFDDTNKVYTKRDVAKRVMYASIAALALGLLAAGAFKSLGLLAAGAFKRQK